MINMNYVLSTKVGNFFKGDDLVYKCYFASLEPHFYFVAYVIPKTDSYDIFFAPEVNNYDNTNVVKISRDSRDSRLDVAYGDKVEINLSNDPLSGESSVIKVSLGLDVPPISVNLAAPVAIDIEEARALTEELVEPLHKAELHSIANLVKIEVEVKLQNIAMSSVGIDIERIVNVVAKNTLSNPVIFEMASSPIYAEGSKYDIRRRAYISERYYANNSLQRQYAQGDPLASHLSGTEVVGGGYWYHYWITLPDDFWRNVFAAYEKEYVELMISNRSLYVRAATLSPSSDSVVDVFVAAVKLSKELERRGISMLVEHTTITSYLVSEWLKYGHNDQMNMIETVFTGEEITREIQLNASSMEDSNVVYQVISKIQDFVYLKSVTFKNLETEEEKVFPLEYEFYGNITRSTDDYLQIKGMLSEEGSIVIQYGYATGQDSFVGIFATANNGDRFGLRKDEKIVNDVLQDVYSWHWKEDSVESISSSIDSSNNVLVTFTGV